MVAVTRYWRGVLVVGALVLSHWVFDWIVHRPDLPLLPWSDSYAGLGLWNSVPATILIETLLFALGVAATPRSRARQIARGGGRSGHSSCCWR